MRIQGPKNISPPPSGKPNDKTSDLSDRPAAFARLLTPEKISPALAPASGGRPVSSLNPLLTVDPIGDEPRRRRHNRKRAETILDQLDAIRHGLLFGTIPGETLLMIAERLAAAREAVSDAGMLEILDEIDLRAQVELAKLEMEREAMEAGKKR